MYKLPAGRNSLFKEQTSEEYAHEKQFYWLETNFTILSVIGTHK